MSLILNIDTTSDKAIVNIAENGIVLQEEINDKQKDHAAFLQPAVQSLLKKTGITTHDLMAIAVCYGPGSYTGIRVGMSSAKGLCYALNKPLIVLNALEILAKDVIDNNDLVLNSADTLYCPMIDARRMEVYTAVYDRNLKVVLPPAALILDKIGPDNIIFKDNILFFGNGAYKWQSLIVHENTQFPTVKNRGSAMSVLSFNKLLHNDFADTVYAEPLYIKEFHTIDNV